MMKKNVWKKIMPALVAAATLAGSSAVAQAAGDKDVTYQPTAGNVPISISLDGTVPTGWVTVISNLGTDTETLTITGGAGATLTYTGAAATDGVFAFRNIGDTTNLAKLGTINIDHLTLTGGNASRQYAFGGGAYISGFANDQVINIRDSAAIGNKVTGTGTNNEAGGGGLNLNNNATTLATGVKANLENIVITGNTASGEDFGYGGGVTVAHLAEINIDGADISRNTAIGTGNSAGDAAGGGITIFNELSTVSTVKISNATIQGNIAKSEQAYAFGGGLWLQSVVGSNEFEVEITDTDFIDNKAIGKTGSRGGAIFNEKSDTTITISAIKKDVLFSGNSASDAGNSIYSKGNVTYSAAKGRTITDEDGFYVEGTVGVGGEGKLKLGASNGDDREFYATTIGVGYGGTLELGDGASLTANQVGADFGVGTINVASGAYLGTRELGVLGSGATAADPNVLNTNGDIYAEKVSGVANTILNIQSGTVSTYEINSLGTVNIDGRLLLGAGYNANPALANSVATLTGNGNLFFSEIKGLNDTLLKVTDNQFTGTVTAVDTLGVGVKKGADDKSYVSYASDVAYIADGYLAVASIHNFNAGWQATQDHLISGRARRLGFLGQSECDPCEPAGCNPCDPVGCNPCDPCGALVGSGSRSAWVNYVGRNNQYQSSYNGRDFWNTTSNGVQVGVDLYRTCNNQFGVLFGYEKSDSNMRANSIDADDVYLGFYAAHVFSGGADARIVANFGWQNYDSIRSNYLGTPIYTSSFDGRTTELNLELGKRFYRSSSLSFRPVAAIDLYINDVDGTSEDLYDGVTQNGAVKYNGLSYTQTFLRFGSDFQLEGRRAKLNGGVYYAYDLNNNKLQSSVTGINTVTNNLQNFTLYGSDLGRQVVTFNVGGSFKLSSKFDVFGGFTGNAYVDRDGTPFQSVGYVGGAVRW